MGLVHDVARLSGGRVTGRLEGPAVGRSYYSVLLSIAGESITLLMNPAARLVACVHGERPVAAGATFMEVPEPGTFDRAGWMVGSPSDMEMSVSDRDLSALDADEVEQIRYHRPDRIGDVLFNWFDQYADRPGPAA